MVHSSACWKTVTEARQVFNKLTSVTAQKEAVNDHIRIIVVGVGWDDLHPPWSKDDVDFTPEQLREHLINKIITEQSKSKRGIPDAPTVNIPSRGDRNQLGTKPLDVDGLKRKKQMTRSSQLGMVERSVG